MSGVNTDSRRELWRLGTNRATPAPLAANMAFLCDGSTPPIGFGIYLSIEENQASLSSLSPNARSAVLPSSAEFLCNGDVIRLVPQSLSYRVLFRANANNNSILLTERCN